MSAQLIKFRDLVAQIPKRALGTAPLTHRGIGPDKKFLVRHQDGHQLLLRVADISCLQSKQQIFELSSRLHRESGVAMPQPLAVGQSRDRKHAYILLSFLEGEDFDVAFDALSTQEQYARGRLTPNSPRAFAFKP